MAICLTFANLSAIIRKIIFVKNQHNRFDLKRGIWFLIWEEEDSRIVDLILIGWWKLEQENFSDKHSFEEFWGFLKNWISFWIDFFVEKHFNTGI